MGNGEVGRHATQMLLLTFDGAKKGVKFQFRDRYFIGDTGRRDELDALP